ncbi:hypothetical protein TNCT_668391 [Trichonephila clavata]|uniref:Uncharacterized protein n=1 Tax=Trichonephila clavata TaxID=2740835 RepID=A0A8X6KY77_TRICU|nr:hypothetical protein TNCT_668391 [Trichonephila clavata]
MQYYWNEYTNFRGEAKHSEHFLFIYVNHNDKKKKKDRKNSQPQRCTPQGAVSVKPRFRSTRRGRPTTAFHDHFTGSAEHPNEASIRTRSSPLPDHFKVRWNTGTKLHNTTPPRRLVTSKFTSPKPLLLATSCSLERVSLRRPIHSELLATFLHLSRRRGSRHRGPHEPAPSSGGPRKISKSKTTRSRHHLPSSSPLALPFNTDSILSRLPHEPRTHSTSPDGLAPVTRARTRQRPLPVDLEKFRSPLPVLCITLLFRIKLDPLTCEPRTNRAPLLPSPGPACPLPVDFSTR